MSGDPQRIPLIVGLGNPGIAYEQTRHNIGYRAVIAFAKRCGILFKEAPHLHAELASGHVKGQKVFLLLPLTYMNSSGEAVRACIDYFKLSIGDLLVACDDVYLAFAKLRLRLKGSDGGHNGLKSIGSHLRTEYYSRLRIGIGNREEGDLAAYVLGRFSEEEREALPKVIERTVDVLEAWVLEGAPGALKKVGLLQT